MNNGKNERFRVYLSSFDADIAALTEACESISNSLNSVLESTKREGFINPIQVFIDSLTLNQPETHSNIWVAVNSSWQIAEEARLKLEKFGYKTGEII